MNDSRFGITGVSEPEVCAISGQPARGRHANTYHLTGGAVYYVLAKYVSQWTPALHDTLQAAFTAASMPVTGDLPADSSSKKGK